jgi:glycogen operon protein
MHWIEHFFALPTLPAGKKWHRAADTSAGEWGKPILLENQKKMIVKERSIVFLIGK